VPKPGSNQNYSITSSAIASSVVGMSRPQQSRMWTPWCGRQQLDLLCHDKRPELRGKAFHEVLIGEDPCPVLPPVGVVIKLPEMDKLVDRASGRSTASLRPWRNAATMVTNTSGDALWRNPTTGIAGCCVAPRAAMRSPLCRAA
jgi:hypothetical protein